MKANYFLVLCLTLQVGNAVTDDYHDYVGTFEYWWTHGLISDSTYRTLRKVCDYGSSEHPSSECLNALVVAQREQGNIDPYSIFTSPCNNTVALNRNLRGHYVSLINPFSLWKKNLGSFCSCIYFQWHEICSKML